MRQIAIAVAVTAAILAASSATAHIPGHCIPAGLEETISRKAALSNRITAAANRNQLMEVLDSIAAFMQVDGRLSKMMGAMLECSVR